jgi:hypothetical protein
MTLNNMATGNDTTLTSLPSRAARGHATIGEVAPLLLSNTTIVGASNMYSIPYFKLKEIGNGMVTNS